MYRRPSTRTDRIEENKHTPSPLAPRHTHTHTTTTTTSPCPSIYTAAGPESMAMSPARRSADAAACRGNGRAGHTGVLPPRVSGAPSKPRASAPLCARWRRVGVLPHPRVHAGPCARARAYQLDTCELPQRLDRPTALAAQDIAGAGYRVTQRAAGRCSRSATRRDSVRRHAVGEQAAPSATESPRAHPHRLHHCAMRSTQCAPTAHTAPFRGHLYARTSRFGAHSRTASCEHAACVAVARRPAQYARGILRVSWMCAASRSCAACNARVARARCCSRVGLAKTGSSMLAHCVG